MEKLARDAARPGATQGELRLQQAEFQRQKDAAIETARRAVETLLSQDELAQLNEIAYMSGVPAALSDPAIQEKLQLSPEQLKRLRAAATAYHESAFHVFQASVHDSLAVLDSQQLQKLMKPRPH